MLVNSIAVSHICKHRHTQNAIVSFDYCLEKADTPSVSDIRRNEKVDTTSVFASPDAKTVRGSSNSKMQSIASLSQTEFGPQKTVRGLFNSKTELVSLLSLFKFLTAIFFILIDKTNDFEGCLKIDNTIIRVFGSWRSVQEGV